MRLAFVGTYPRGIAAGLHALGHEVTLFADDATVLATLARMERDPGDPLRALLPTFDLLLTSGGGEPVVRRFEALGARECIPLYHALDPATHHPVPPREDLRVDLALLADRRPGCEARVEEFFFRAVELLPERTFLLGGEGWDDRVRGVPNLRYLGPGPDDNAVNCSALAVLNVTRADEAANGWFPTARLFAAAGAGACVISDTWRGIEDFLRPCKEVQLARNGEDVAELLRTLDEGETARAGAAARERVLAEHTYAHRARRLEAILAVHA
jgi:spore maturation protein CgeB